MEILLQLASAVAFYVFTFVMFEKFYPRKEVRLSTKIPLIAVIAVGMVLIGFIHEPILNFVYSLASMILLNKVLYKTSGKSYIIYDAILLFAMLAIEMIAVSLLALTINKELNEILNNIWYTSAATVLNWILFFIAFRVYLFVISDKQITEIKTQEFVFFVILVSAEIFFLHFTNDILTFSKVKYELTLILLAFLALDLYIAYLFYEISKSYELQKKLNLTTQQLQLQLNAYRDMNEKYGASQRIIHDVKKHIVSLEGLINDNNIETAQKYKNLLNVELDKLVPQFKSDNPILSVIVNNKLMIAQGMKVDFVLNIEFSELDFLSELDITTIFSNILDNAFEACEELPENKRRIRLSVTRHNYFLVANVKNTYKTVSENKKGKYNSTKENHQGVGLSNVESAIEKYDGVFCSYAKEGLFHSEFTIPIPIEMVFKNN